MTEKNKESPPSFWSVIAENFVEGEKAALRFARAGAIVGAVLGAALGFYLIDIFGLIQLSLGV